MQLIFKKGDGLGEGILFLTKGDHTDPNSNFQLLAEADFWNLEPEDKEALEYFIEEANEILINE